VLLQHASPHLAAKLDTIAISLLPAPSAIVTGRPLFEKKEKAQRDKPAATNHWRLSLSTPVHRNAQLHKANFIDAKFRAQYRAPRLNRKRRTLRISF